MTTDDTALTEHLKPQPHPLHPETHPMTLRTTALTLASRYSHESIQDELNTADQYLHWLNQPNPPYAAKLTATTPTNRNNPHTGATVSLVMPDNDQVTITITALDAEQVPVTDDFTDPAGIYLAPFTWTTDNTQLAQITVAPDTLSITLDSAPGQTGIATVTATDSNGKSAPSFTVEIDPSAPATAGLVAGTPVPRTA